MENKKVIFEGNIGTNIYDTDLKNKVGDLVKNSKVEFDSEMYHELELKFDLENYKNEKLENKKEQINQLLGEQLSNVENCLEERIGISIASSVIVGDKINDLNLVEVMIKEERKKEYDKKGKLKKEFRIKSIMADRPFLMEQFAKVVWEEMKKDNIK